MASVLLLVARNALSVIERQVAAGETVDHGVLGSLNAGLSAAAAMGGEPSDNCELALFNLVAQLAIPPAPVPAEPLLPSVEAADASADAKVLPAPDAPAEDPLPEKSVVERPAEDEPPLPLSES